VIGEDVTTKMQRSFATRRRLRHAATAVWGTVSGVAPHVLHHVGPLAGAAILAGTGGRVLFFVIGLGVATPMLWRLYRRFGTWAAPVIAVAVFVLTYTVSSLYVGPLLTGETAAPADTPSPTTTLDEHGH
jgi:peptidoglycan/LPS O-acetylase OafA/YrhL